jgi:hypothetical protein
MSERSHSRFAGLQMTVFKLASPPDAQGRQAAVLHLNDAPLEATVIMTVAMPAIVLARLARRPRFEDPPHKRIRSHRCRLPADADVRRIRAAHRGRIGGGACVARGS